MLRVKAPTAQGRLTLCCFCIWNSSASGHATAPTRKNDRAYRPSSVCPSGSHLPPGEGIPQMGRYTFTLSNRTPPPTPSVTPPPTRREAYALPLLHMEFERIGACHRPYTQKRSCLPPLIRLPFGQPPSPRGRHPSDGSVHFYVVQPYTPSDTFGDTSPYTPGGLRFAASAYGIRAHRGMPPPLHAKTIVPTAPHPSALRAATFPQGKASLR